LSENKWKVLLIGIIMISLLAAGYTGWQRHKVEEKNNSMAIAVVYDEVASLARMSEKSTTDVLNEFKKKGVNTVLIKEPTVRDAEANGELVMLTGSELLLPGNDAIRQQFDEQFREQIKPDRRYLIISDADTYNRVSDQLGYKNVPFIQMGKEGSNFSIIEVAYNWDLFEQIGLGFPASVVSVVNEVKTDTKDDTKLDIMVQVRSWNQVTPDGLADVLDALKDIKPNLSGVLFNDPVLPGFPEQVGHLHESLNELNVPLVQVESSKQKGASNLGLLLGKNVVRLHTLSLEEQAKKDLDIAAMVERFNLAATERNIRVLLLHTYMKNDAPDMLDFNLQLVQQTSDDLDSAKLQVGSASLLEPKETPSLLPSLLLFVTGLGAIAGAMLLVLMMGWVEGAVGIGILGLLAWSGMLAVDMVNPARKIMAFIAAVVFPTLSVMVNVRQGGVSVAQSVMLLLRTSLYSLVGALLIVGLLGDLRFMLQLDQFTGITLALLTPLLLLAVIFYIRGAKVSGNWRHKLQYLLDLPLLVKFAMFAGVALVVLYVYVNRAGNEAAVIFPMELQFRSWLDHTLVVRPRTKEFLIGHPLMLLLLYLGYRNNKYIPLLLGGVIGQISLVDTYAHIHTPLAISLLRSFHGLWLGIIIGLVLIALWRIGENLINRWDWLRELMIRD